MAGRYPGPNVRSNRYCNDPHIRQGSITMATTNAPLKTPTDLKTNAAKTVAEALNGILADSFALSFKTKNSHCHVSGPHFHDYHLIFDAQAAQTLPPPDQTPHPLPKPSPPT